MNKHAIKPRLIRLRYFVWLLVPIGIYLLSQSYGLPHMRWSYRYIDNGATQPSMRHYTMCTYVGVSGVITLSAINGRCAFVQLLKTE